MKRRDEHGAETAVQPDGTNDTESMYIGKASAGDGQGRTPDEVAPDDENAALNASTASETRTAVLPDAAPEPSTAPSPNAAPGANISPEPHFADSGSTPPNISDEHNDTPKPKKRRRRGLFSCSLERGGTKKISIRWQLFALLTLFTAVIILILWLCQVVFLDRIYKTVKTVTIERTAHRIEELISSTDDFADEASALAEDRELCLLVLRMVSDGRAEELCSVEAQRSCVIHNAEKSSVFVFYRESLEAGGEMVYRYRYSTEWRSYISSQNPMYDQLDAENESIIYSIVANEPDGTAVLLLLNSVISPVDATVTTLNAILIAVSVLLVLLSLLMAVLISKKISRPIESLSCGAKELATGNYNVDFSTSGYREIGELAESLDYAQHELSKADSLRRELIANVSHDLRTPLTMISGYAEIMRDIPGENSAENLQVIIDEAGRLRDLVNDVLDISRIESGARKLDITRFSLTELIRGATETYSKLTEKRGFAITFDCDTDAIVESDRTVVQQIFYNLLNNAINYSGDSRTVKVTQTISPDGSAVRITVRDYGEGIPEDKLPLIWDRYYKVDKVHRRAAVGTGLGLSIVRGSTELLGGACGVSSTVGSGSSFWFELPLRGC